MAIGKKRSEELKRENLRIHNNSINYFTEKNKKKKDRMKYRAVEE